MLNHSAPILHRDDPEKEPLIGHVKVTQVDWLNMARDVLVNEGAGEVKILTLANRMCVSRSSFYWYFKDRADLMAALLDEWEVRNTAQIVKYCQFPSENITHALCNFFKCFVDITKFDWALDFAVREWSRRDSSIRSRLDQADSDRIMAVTECFVRHGYAAADADARARIVYFMQLGYHALEVREDMTTRMSRLEPYIKGFTGQKPHADAVRAFLRDVGNMDYS